MEAAPAGGFARYFRAGRADLDALSEGLVDLPETAIELDSVAASLGSGKDVVFTERKATEARVKEMSRAGNLANFRVLHFATHALVAGEVSEVSRGLSEPALALSLPDKATREDDGLLTASEVAELRLNASLVVLSACNTAAGDSRTPRHSRALPARSSSPVPADCWSRTGTSIRMRQSTSSPRL